ncbi:MAG: hypothetical protein K2H35_03975 [Muribaculaceae bacterium]|nr:hypothetical protein [Muribaculaceae bacterium]
MYQFFSSLPEAEINRRYLNTFRTASFNKKFEAAMGTIPELAGLLPEDVKGEDILIYNFNKLTSLYYSYIEKLSTLTDERRSEINERLSGVFNYSSYRPKIRGFLCNPDNGFEIHNCVYCDIHHFHTYKKNGKLCIDFHADHVLDEGKCPLVGLSIHNFVPSCAICNEGGNKGTKTLGRSKRETLKISPKSRQNRFESDVDFFFTPSCEDIKDLRMFRGNEGWEIDFNYSVAEYGRTIELFSLRERYNAEKGRMGEFIFRRRNNPDTKIRNDAQALKVLFEKRVEELFEFERNKMDHAPMEKCRRELIKQVYGSLPGGVPD